MPAPRFLDIEYCQTDDVLFPVAMAWSLEDGQMKTVVIAPADEWIPEDADLGDIDLLYLEEQGVPLIELAQELHQDLPDQTVYVDGMDPDEILVDLIFTAVAMDAPFEIAGMEDWSRPCPGKHWTTDAGNCCPTKAWNLNCPKTGSMHYY